MRILYGVCGEGMGHAIRSSVVADHLRTQGHELCFTSSGRALDYLGGRALGATVQVPGLTLSKRQGGEISPLDTIVKNVVHQALGSVFEAPLAATAVMRFRPEAVISDFEPWSARYARLSSAPLLAVDNIHFLSRCVHPPEMISRSVAIAAAVTAAMIPFADHYFIPSLFRAPTSDDRTALYPPVLRPEILRARTAARGQHLTVYLNEPDGDTLKVLATSGAACHVWRSQPGAYHQYGSVTEFPFEEKAFISDLAACRAVVGSAGSQLTSEASYLQRPMLALPIQGQGEQELNGAYFQRGGYGESHPRLTPAALASFLDRAPLYQRRLAELGHDENRSLFAALDAALGAR